MKRQMVRYVINGLVATGVHFLVLSILMEHAQLPSAGMANLMAAVFGILTSFLGNRYFVFAKEGRLGRLGTQGVRFLASYGVIALVHGSVLTLWSDLAGWDYRLGFLVAMVFQVGLGYLANKYFVFRDKKPAAVHKYKSGSQNRTETHWVP